MFPPLRKIRRNRSLISVPQINALWRAVLSVGGTRQRRTSRSMQIIDREEHRIAHPGVDLRFAPSRATRADAHLLRKRAALNFAVERRTAEAGAIEQDRKSAV